MSDADSSDAIEGVRRFSRFFTRKIGVLHEGLLGSSFSLTEGRIIYELAKRGATTAARLGGDLSLDAGYVSRILSGLTASGLIARHPSKADGRETVLSLTDEGQAAFSRIDARSREDVGTMLGRLTVAEQRNLGAAFGTIEDLLGERHSAGSQAHCEFRTHRPGDMGWIVHRQAVLYAQEYGWDEQFEALVAEIVSTFIRSFDAERDRCWIAERAGSVVGSIFLVRQTTEIAKLRLLYVEPATRGLGIGRRLVDECLQFARQVGYRRVTLWTNDILTSARHIYEKAGFRLVAQEQHHSFGHDLVGQNWELEL